MEIKEETKEFILQSRGRFYMYNERITALKKMDAVNCKRAIELMYDFFVEGKKLTEEELEYEDIIIQCTVGSWYCKMEGDSDKYIDEYARKVINGGKGGRNKKLENCEIGENTDDT